MLSFSKVDPDPSWGLIFQSSLASHGRYTEVTEASGGGGKGAASPGSNSRIDGYLVDPGPRTQDIIRQTI